MTLGTTSCMHFLHSFLVPEATEDLQTKLSRICEESPRTAKNHTDQRQQRHTLKHSPATTCKTNHKPPSPQCGGGGVDAAWRLQQMEQCQYHKKKHKVKILLKVQFLKNVFEKVGIEMYIRALNKFNDIDCSFYFFYEIQYENLYLYIRILPYVLTFVEN